MPICNTEQPSTLMNQPHPPFTFTETVHTPLHIGAYTVTPLAHAAALQLPFGGLVWNRPIALEVRYGEQVERIPIPDVTRLGQFAAAAAGAFLAILLWLLLRHR